MLDVILGGITGLIGNAFTTWFKYKNAKMENEHKENMLKLESQAMVQEAQMQIEVTKSRIEGEIELADTAAFDTSQQLGQEKLFHEKWIDMIMDARKSSKWFGWFYGLVGTFIAAAFALVDWLNTAMRPTLTIYLVGASTYITYLAWQIMQASGLQTMTATQAVGIFNQVTSTMIFLAVSAVTWWFGDRTVSKYLQQRDARDSRTPKSPSSSPGGKPKPGGAGDVDI